MIKTLQVHQLYLNYTDFIKIAYSFQVLLIHVLFSRLLKSIFAFSPFPHQFTQIHLLLFAFLICQKVLKFTSKIYWLILSKMTKRKNSLCLALMCVSRALLTFWVLLLSLMGGRLCHLERKICQKQEIHYNLRWNQITWV